MALRDHLLGDPEQLALPGLARGVRRGSEGFAVRCVRAVGERGGTGAVDVLLPLLAHRSAALRRAAARALGHLGATAALPGLRALLASERTEEGRLAAAVAAVRCGEDAAATAATVDRFDRRTLLTVGGARAPSAVTGGAPLADRLWLALGGPGEIRPREALVRERRAAVTGAPTGGRSAEALQALASLGHPADLAVLQALHRSVGRRGEHTLLAGLGLNGDPRAAPILRDALRATDVDPGRGFAQRRIAATALGRIGLNESAPWLLRALEDEVADYEGRPGAGLGIQYPVRTNLLWALGELASTDALPALLAHLADTHGSALGGFYLPAMDALTKLGPAAFPALRDTAARAPEVTAAHAVAVLAYGGDALGRWCADARPTVRRIANEAMSLRGAG